MYNELCELLKFELPSWENLPKEPILMDNLLHYLKSILSPLSKDKNMEITRTMINNYVKWNLIPKPIGRKYDKNQIAMLIAILIFKPILSVGEISEGILVQTKTMDLSVAYDKLADSFNRIKVQILEPIVHGDNEFNFKGFSWRRDEFAMSSAITSLVLLIMTRIILNIGGIINDKNSIHMWCSMWY